MHIKNNYSSIIEIEKAVLGACMLEPVFGRAQILTPQSFYHPDCGMVFTAMAQMWPDKPIDILTVTQHLNSTGMLHRLSAGVLSVSDMVSRVASSANIDYHVRIVFESYVRRNAIELLTDYSIHLHTQQEHIQSAILISTVQQAKAALEHNTADLFDLIDALPRIIARLGADEQYVNDFTALAQSINSEFRNSLNQQQANTILTHLLNLPGNSENAATTQAMRLLADAITIVHTKKCDISHLHVIQKMYNELLNTYKR